MLLALVLALFAQGEHTAQVFANFSHRAGDTEPLAYAFAAAVEVAVLLFVMNGHKTISYIFAGATFATNLVYYAIGGIDLLSVAVLPVLLLSALLPGVIVGYSHTIAATGVAPAAPAATPRRNWRQWWRKDAAPATVQATSVVATAPAATWVDAVDDALAAIVQQDARTTALQMASEGVPVAQIAAQVDAKPATVRSWIARERARRNGNGAAHE
jgi:transposase-like protein